MHGVPVRLISIHALRGEGDVVSFAQSVDSSEFLSTPSVGGRRRLMGSYRVIKIISIHALRGEGDGPRSWPGWCRR